MLSVKKSMLSIAIMGVLSQGTAYAQDKQESAVEERELEVIMVSAQKRSESLQKVPVAVSAYSGENLEKMGIKDFSDLTKASPSLTITDTGGNKNENPVNLRGIGTYAFSVGIESSVALIVDDVPVARSGAFFTALNDVASVEILRGPQSTLFGKNSSAGLISVQTNNPTEYFEGSVDLTITDDGERSYKGMVSGPLTDTLGVRVTAYDSSVDGYIKNLTLDEDISSTDSKGARAKFLWEPTDDLDLTFIAEINKSNDKCCLPVFVELSDDYVLTGATADVISEGMTINTDNRSVRSAVEGAPQSDSEETAYSVKIDYDLNDFTLTSVTALRDWEYNWTTNYIPHDQLSLFATGPYESKQFTQELRLTSPASDTFQYVVGAYYTDIESDRGFERGPIAVSQWAAQTYSKSTALFGQFDAALTDKLSAIVGLRFNHEKFGVIFDKYHVDPDEHYEADNSDDAVFGKAVLNYDASDDTMYYVSYSQGYKAGGYDVSSGFSQRTADNPVGAETVDSYEVGAKQTLLNGLLNVNTSLFYTTFSDFQAQAIIVNDDGSSEPILYNVGDTRTSGVDVDIRAYIGDNWAINGGFSYTKAEIESFTNATCYSGQTEALGCINGIQDLSGTELSNSPDFKASFTLDYNAYLDAVDVELFSSLAYQWQSKTHFDLLNNPNSKIDSYGIANFNIGVRDLDDTYRVTLFVNNIFDQYYYTGVLDYSNFFDGNGETAISHFIPRGANRYMGVRVHYNF